MSTTKLVYGRIKGVGDDVQGVADAMKTYGLSSGNEYGVTNVRSTAEALRFTFVRQSNQSFKKIGGQEPELQDATIVKATPVDVIVNVAKDRIVLLGGTHKLFDHLTAFFAELSLPIVVESIDLDIKQTVDALGLEKEDLKFQILSAGASDVPIGGDLTAKVDVKFRDSGVGREFIEDKAAALDRVQIKYLGVESWVKVTVGGHASFSVSHHAEEDTRAFTALLSKIVYRG